MNHLQSLPKFELVLPRLFLSLASASILLLTSGMMHAQPAYPATPFVSPAPGTYASARSITISDSTPGATIYYTTDGSTPTTHSSVYTSALSTPSTPASETVKAIAVLNNLSSSVATSAYKISPVLAMPTLSPAPGNFTGGVSVKLASSVPGAVIHYTTDGSLPTAASPTYVGTAIAVQNRTSIRALVAGMNGYSDSAVAVGTYAVFPQTPFISPSAGTYSSAQTVAISVPTTGAMLYYTTDGSTPTVASTPYAGPITIPATSGTTKTIRAIAAANGLASSVATSAYSIIQQLPAPQFSLAQGNFMTAQTVALSAPAPGKTIYYTTDGTIPSTKSPIYNGTPIPVTTGRVTITAMVGATASYSASPTAQNTYTILPATPYITPASGTYTTSRTIAISDSTVGVTIYYTTDGSAPTLKSAIYTAPFTTPSTATTETVRAFAVSAGVYSSAASAAYEIAPLLPVALPVITPGSGTQSTNVPISISDSTPGSTIFYTTDGSTPTGSSTKYTGPFSFSGRQTGTMVVKAMGYMPGMLNSGVSQSTITFSLPPGVIATTTASASSVVRTIPTNFLGFAHDWGSAQTLMGNNTTGTDPIYKTLFTTLATNMNGPLVLRIEGDTTANATDITPTSIQPLLDFAQSSNVKYIMGVNMRSNNPGLATEQAQAYYTSIPANLLTAVEMGNEPDGYSGLGFRGQDYSYADYLLQYRQWAAGSRAGTSSSLPIAGPVLGTGSWIPNAQTDVSSGNLQANLVTQHKYLACYYANAPLASDILLQPASSEANLLWQIQPYVAAAHQAGSVFRMAEMNSICLGGQPGVSNSFSSALWGIDTMFEYANAGVDGVNWNTSYMGGAYDLFHIRSWNNGHKNLYNLVDVRPLYYGLLMFSKAAGYNAQLLNASTLTNSNIKVWSTVDNIGQAHIVIINKEQKTSGTVQITLPGYVSGSVVRLKASSYLATDGVTIGGQTYDGSTDGTLQGTAQPEIITQQNGIWSIPVSAMSAVLVNLIAQDSNAVKPKETSKAECECVPVFVAPNTDIGNTDQGAVQPCKCGNVPIRLDYTLEAR